MIERIGGEQQAQARIAADERPGPAATVECECPEFCRIDHDYD